ncbi:MAG: hypothetical protein ACE5F8_05815, partial [Woeseiaceae bacterium]
SDKHQVSLLTEYVDQVRTIGVQTIDVDRFLANLNSNYSFSGSSRLTSTVFGLNSDSQVSKSKTFLWSERLMVQHKPNLRSDYTARFDSRENENFRSDARILSAGIEHLLYENLTTRLELYSSNDDFNDGQVDVGEADLNFRYVRKIPTGVLSISNGYAYRLEDNNIDAASSQVLNESLSLTGSAQEFLARSNVDVASIVVTDATETVTFIEGIDYAVSIVGTSVSIERLIFGGIADGDTVLVDYVFATRAPFEADRFSSRFGVNLQLWRTLRLYYNFSRIEEDLISGTRPSDLSDDRIRRLGASLRWRFSTTTVDYEVRDTVRTPLKRRRYQQSFAFRPTPSFSFGVSASYAKTDFLDTGSDSQAHGYAANLRWDLGRWGRFEIDAFTRDIDGESQQIRSEGLVSRWSLRYGAWNLFARYEDLDEADDLTTQTRDRRLVTLQLSRIFR